MGNHAACSDCQIGCHQKCKELATNTCGGVGTLKLKIDITKSIIMESAHYADMLQTVMENNYCVLMLFGKISNGREDAARCMLRIMQNEYHNFVKSIVRQEIMNSDDSKTLFRGNSMASKGLDLYMKHIGTDYLKASIEEVLKIAVLSKKPVEVSYYL